MVMEYQLIQTTSSYVYLQIYVLKKPPEDMVTNAATIQEDIDYKTL